MGSDNHSVDLSRIRELEQENARLRAEIKALQHHALMVATSDAHQRAILDAAPDSMITIDSKSRVKEWNHAAELTFGYARDTVLGRDLVDLIIPPELHEVYRCSMARYLETNTEPMLQHQVEWEAIHASGRRLLVELTIKRTWSGGDRHFTIYLRDVSECRIAEAELRQSEARYRLLADNASDIIVRTDLDGYRRYVSPACKSILGYQPQELVGTRLAESVHPEDLATATSGIQALLAGTAEQDTAVYRMRHRDGHWVWIEAKRRLVRDEAGQPQEALSVLRDISERTHLQERLRQSQKMEVVGQLTGGIAHDFNNLLTVILSNAEVLVEEAADPEIRNLANVILESAERGADLTQHLLAYGRRQTLKPVQVSLDHIVTGMLPLLRRTLGAQIEFRTEFATSQLSALTDRTLLESAVLNLAVNARDAMPDGGTLTIQTGERTARAGEGALPIGQPVVFVTISDTGTGMTPDVLQRVFEPFFTTKDVGKGSGLGLAMVHGFAQQTGGHLAMESIPGVGTSVTIVMPAVTAKVVEPDNVREEDLSPTRGSERILVVEDEPQVLQFVSAQLLSLGYDVTAVSNGPDAVEVLENDIDFDLLFTDVVMPKGMSGVELARRAREIKPGLRVLLTSGHSQDVFERNGRPDADIELLRKPYRRTELAKVIREVLSQPVRDRLISGRILIVDDQKHNRDVVQKLLKDVGHKVEVATNGAEAIMAVQSNVYDLVLMESQMPVMDGVAAARAIRALDYPSRYVPIIAITGNVSPQQVRSFKEAGMNDYLAKPFKRGKLLEKVNAWLPPDGSKQKTRRARRKRYQVVRNSGLKDMLNLMGREWVEGGLQKLRMQIEETFGQGNVSLVDRVQLGQRAHALVAHAALFGFADLSQRCSALEEACLSGVEVESSFRSAAAEARAVAAEAARYSER
jgi:PAS domain S-box-containing protein